MIIPILYVKPRPLHGITVHKYEKDKDSVFIEISINHRNDMIIPILYVKPRPLHGITVHKYEKDKDSVFIEISIQYIWFY